MEYCIDWAEPLLRKAFNLPEDYRLSDDDIDTLNERFAAIVPYVIIFVARSGSTFLTFELEATSTLGAPHEWFNYDNIAAYVRDNPMSFVQYCSEAVETSKSANGIFGCEANWPQLSALLSVVDIQRIFRQPIRWFVLSRRNIVAQAVSHYIARTSGIYHAHEMMHTTAHTINKIGYNAKEIMLDIEEILQQEQLSRSWLKAQGITPVELCYEDIVSDSKATAMLFSNVMGAPLPYAYLEGRIANRITKMPRENKGAYEEKFRREEAAFVELATSRRIAVKACVRDIQTVT